MSRAVRIGISVRSAYPATPDPRAPARWMVERARAAWDAGLDSLFVGDHHATPRPYIQNVPILGRILAEWGDRPIGALFLLPVWHPVLLAEQVATLATLARGRFILQCAGGDAQQGLRELGIDPRQRPSRVEQSIAILRRLWAGEVVSHQGRWTLDQARISPLPPEPIEIWLGASAPRAIERAARLADGWIAWPGLPPAEARAQLAQYTEACEAARRPRGAAVIRRDVYVGESADEAASIARAALEAGYRGFTEDALVYGDVDGVAESLRSLGEMGYDEVLVRSLVLDQDRTLASLVRLGEVKRRLAGQ